ncbi:MAG: hypothetical protein LBV80_08115 [Deltaproteobacteria bacterium]|jgi:hypothetical protein|nr:hypothetical protein [Deltaproteobacteria bacterium]
MTETANFIRDRALVLPYEVARFPHTTTVATAWIRRAAVWANKNNQKGLLNYLHITSMMILTAQLKSVEAA